MLSAIEYAKVHGIGQTCPDSSVVEVVSALVAEVERLESQLETERDEWDVLRGAGT